MEIKFIGFVLLIILQNGSSLHVKNCTNSSETSFNFAPNPRMKFYLFTKQNFYIEQEIFTDNKTSLEKSKFNQKWPVRIIVHGWQNFLKSCINGYIKDAYLKKGNFNVIVVDWHDWARNVNYNDVVPYIFNLLGPLLANFIQFLNLDGKIPFDNIYLIGHSLGAHISGSAGQNLRPYKINTIFGLDPAGQQFKHFNNEGKLNKYDAAYVEQITTNINKFGYPGTIGNAVFYPNYGDIQPYCIKYEPNDITCSHSFAYWLFAESINTPVGFCAEPCSFLNIALGAGCKRIKCINGQIILMGGEPSIPKNGTYYLKTNIKPKFAQCKC